MVVRICVFSFWGLRLQTPTGALPLDPAGDICPSPLCPNPKQISGYAGVRPWGWGPLNPGYATEHNSTGINTAGPVINATLARLN